MNRNNTEKPLVSVLMPVYNARATLESAIKSVLNQSYEHLELILIDDGSTDGSPKIAKDLSDNRVRIVVQKENRGTAHVQNIGFKLLEGEIVALHDSDDLWHPDKLKRHVDHLMNNAEIDVSFSYSQMINAQGGLIRNVQKFSQEAIHAEQILCRHPVGNGSNAVFRRHLLAKTWTAFSYIVDERLGPSHDIEMWFRIHSLTNCRFGVLPEVLTFYRISDGSYSSDLRRKEADFSHLLELAKIYAPQTIFDLSRKATAFHNRYLARRAFARSEPWLGLRFAIKAIMGDPLTMLLSEAPRTLNTLGALTVLAVLPSAARPHFLRVSGINRI